ncbi:MAG TPA: hypothetical protein VIO14_04490 [Dehalococcoidia bacterium]
MSQEPTTPAPRGPEPGPAREVTLGQEQCPRCHLYFTLSYRENGSLVMARCLSCDLRWPRPDVV